MENTGRIVGINLLIFAIYTLIIHVISGREAAGQAVMFAYAHAGGIFCLGVLLAIFSQGKERSKGGALILSALLITIIGFSVCLGTMDLRL